MRSVDTDALRYVAGALGVGNPATATRPVEFDDDNLQQTLEVGRLIAGPGASDGWLTYQAQIVHAGAGSSDSTLSGIYATIAAWLGLRIDQIDIWAMHVFLELTANSISNGLVALLGAHYNGQAAGASRYRLIARFNGSTQIVAAGTLVGVGFDSTGTGGVIQRPNLEMPIIVPRDADLAIRNTATGALTATYSVDFWVGPRSARPPGVA